MSIAAPERKMTISRRIRRYGRIIMLHRSSTGVFALGAALMAIIGGAQASDSAKYPDWKGQWERFVVRGIPGSRLTTRPGPGDSDNKRR
jgi:hypothetical protein